MAQPRTTQAPKPIQLACRKPEDFPAFIEANDRLTDLQTRRSFKEQEYRVADDYYRTQRTVSTAAKIDAEARSLVGGAVATVEAAPDIRQIRHDIEVLDRAIELQNGVVNDERLTMSKAIAADLRGQHVALMDEFIGAANAMLGALDRLKALRSAAIGHCGVDCLSDHVFGELNDARQNIINQFKHRLQVFEQSSATFRKGE